MSSCCDSGGRGCDGKEGMAKSYWTRKPPTTPPDISTEQGNDKGLDQQQQQDEPDTPFTYQGRHLHAIDFPLGGFGTGNVVLAGDGTLQQWSSVMNGIQTHANWRQEDAGKYSPMPNTWFAIQVYSSDTPNATMATILRTTANSCQHVRQSILPSIPSFSLTGRYPIADVEYQLGGNFPVELSLETFTPLIPGDVKHSSIPCSIFNFCVKNHTDKTQTVRLLASQQNFLGWDGSTRQDTWTEGNVNSPFERGIQLSNEKLSIDHIANGTLCWTAVQSEVTVIPQESNEANMYARFINHKDMHPEQTTPSDPTGPDEPSCTGLVQTVSVPPLAKATASFVLSWHFPNRMRDQCIFDKSWTSMLPDRLGNYYSTHWFPKDARQIANYAMENFDFLCDTTRLYRDTFYQSTIPPNLLQLAGGQLATLRSQTMWYTSDGIVMATEGNGCCPLNCTHVYGYTTLMERLYPTLAQNMLTSNFIHNYVVDKEGDAGWYCGGVSMRFGIYGWAIDGALACIIKVYLVTRQADSNLTFLTSIWPNIKDQLERIQRYFDIHGDGVIRKAQQNTYDTFMQGANTFIGSYYVTALRAVSEMALLMGDTELSDKCSNRATLAVASYEAICWNDLYGYYISDVTEDNCDNSYGPGCFVDQLCAVGLSSACGLGHVFDAEHEATARKSIVRYNVRTMPPFDDLQQHFYPGDSGIIVCSYPRGKLGRGMTYDTLVSSGFTSPIIAGLLLDRNTGRACYLAEMICERQDGRHASPWNEPECNMHYSRQMAHWNIFDQAVGWRYSCIVSDNVGSTTNRETEGGGELSFDPRFSMNDFRCFVALHDGWGLFEQKGDSFTNHTSRSDSRSSCRGLKHGRCALTCLHGRFRVQSLQISTHAQTVRATLDGTTVDVKSFDSSGKAVFASVVVITKGSSLHLSFSDETVEDCSVACGTKNKCTGCNQKQSGHAIYMRYLTIWCLALVAWWILTLK